MTHGGDEQHAALRTQGIDAWEGLARRVPRGVRRVDWLASATGIPVHLLAMAQQVRNENAHRRGAINAERLLRALTVMDDAHRRLSVALPPQSHPIVRVARSAVAPSAALAVGLAVSTLLGIWIVRTNIAVYILLIIGLGAAVGGWLGNRTDLLGNYRAYHTLLLSVTAVDLAAVLFLHVLSLDVVPSPEAFIMLWFVFVIPGSAGFVVGRWGQHLTVRP